MSARRLVKCISIQMGASIRSTTRFNVKEVAGRLVHRIMGNA